MAGFSSFRFRTSDLVGGPLVAALGLILAGWTLHRADARDDAPREMLSLARLGSAAYERSINDGRGLTVALGNSMAVDKSLVDDAAKCSALASQIMTGNT